MNAIPMTLKTTLAPILSTPNPLLAVVVVAVTVCASTVDVDVDINVSIVLILPVGIQVLLLSIVVTKAILVPIVVISGMGPGTEKIITGVYVGIVVVGDR